MPAPQLLQRNLLKDPSPNLEGRKGEGGIREELLGSDDEKGDLPDDHKVRRTMRGAQEDEEPLIPARRPGRKALGLPFSNGEGQGL